MFVIDPYTIPVGDLTSNVDIAETEWTVGTYSLGEQRYQGIILYEVIVSSTSDEPSVGVDADPPTWKVVGNINRWKFYDQKVGTVTSNSDTIEMSIADPSTLVNGLAMFNIKGREVTLEVSEDSEGVVYSSTIGLIESQPITNWYDYFFEPYSQREDVSFTDLPAYFGSGVDISITIDNTGDTAELGEVVLGKLSFLGDTLYPLTTGIRDYSIKDTDDDGNFIIKTKPFSKYADYAISVDAGFMAYVQRTLASLRGTPTAYIGDNDLATSVVYGYFKDFQIVFDTPPLASCSLRIEGLV